MKFLMERRLVYHLLTGSKTRHYRRHRPQRLRNLTGSEPDRHPDMATRKSEPLIEALRVDAAVMGEQFDQLAAAGAGLRQRPLHQLLADAAAAAIGGDADVLDQAARGALRAYSGQDAELQAADDRPALFRDHELQIRIALDPLERLEIARRQRLFGPLARGPERVVGQHAD